MVVVYYCCGSNDKAWMSYMYACRGPQFCVFVLCACANFQLSKMGALYDLAVMIINNI